jgi:hypothetical protein
MIKTVSPLKKSDVIVELSRDCGMNACASLDHFGPLACFGCCQV